MELKCSEPRDTGRTRLPGRWQPGRTSGTRETSKQLWDCWGIDWILPATLNMSLFPLGHLGPRAWSSLCPFLLAPGRKKNKKDQLFPSLCPREEGFYLSAGLTAAGSQRSPPLFLQVQGLSLLISLLPQIVTFLSLLPPRHAAEGTLGPPSLLPSLPSIPGFHQSCAGEVASGPQPQEPCCSPSPTQQPKRTP